MKNKKTTDNETVVLGTIAEFAIEEYRFMRTYNSAIAKLFLEEKKRYVSSLNYHEEKVCDLLCKFGLRFVFFDGQDYDEGMPVTPLNADEFDGGDLIVEQTIEPAVITSEGNTIKQGTVILGRKETREENNTTEDKK